MFLENIYAEFSSSSFLGLSLFSLPTKLFHPFSLNSVVLLNGLNIESLEFHYRLNMSLECMKLPKPGNQVNGNRIMIFLNLNS